MRKPDYRTIVAILTAVAVAVQQALPANHWTVLVSTIIGAVLIHAAPAPAPAAPDVTAATATPTATSGQPTAAP